MKTPSIKVSLKKGIHTQEEWFKQDSLRIIDIIGMVNAPMMVTMTQDGYHLYHSHGFHGYDSMGEYDIQSLILLLHQSVKEVAQWHLAQENNSANPKLNTQTAEE